MHRFSRYPVILRKFCLRTGSGGIGKYRGGDGVSRHLQFRRPLQLSLLTERRVFAPYGLHGGQPGARGANILKRHNDGIRVNLGSKNSVKISTGVIFLNVPSLSLSFHLHLSYSYKNKSKVFDLK